MANNSNDSNAPSGEDARAMADLAAEFKNGPRGALLVSSIAVAAMMAAWLAFYYFIFIPRGPVG